MGNKGGMGVDENENTGENGMSNNGMGMGGGNGMGMSGGMGMGGVDLETQTETRTKSATATKTASKSVTSTLSSTRTSTKTGAKSDTVSATETGSSIKSGTPTKSSTETIAATSTDSHIKSDTKTSTDSSTPSSTKSTTSDTTTTSSSTKTLTEARTVTPTQGPNTKSSTATFTATITDSHTKSKTEAYIPVTKTSIDNNPVDNNPADGVYKDPARYSFEALKALEATIIPDRVSQVLKTTVPGDLLRYLEFQGYPYIKKDFADLSIEDLSSVFEAKKSLLEAKNNLINDYNDLSNNIDSSRLRSAKVQVQPNVSDELDFRTLDLQKGSSGVVAIGSLYSWCTDSASSVAKLRFSDSLKHDLACITSPDGQIYVSPFGGHGFSESFRADITYTIKDSNNSTISSDHADMDFRNSFLFGDFNGDGKDEIAVSHAATSSSIGGLRIYYHDGETPGVWSSHKEKIDFCSNARLLYSVQEAGVRVGDLNGDGKDDLWCHNKNTGLNQVMFSNSTDKGSSFYVPDKFFMDQLSWCVNGYVQIKDMDGDYKEDAICLNSDNSISVLYSSGDGLFASKSGLANGDLNLGAKLNGWLFNLVQSGGFFRRPNFVSSDFDADGRADLWSVVNEGLAPNDIAANRILFGSTTDLLISRTSSLSGKTSLNSQPQSSWCKTGTIISADFNGDKKQDLFCNGYSNNYFMMSYIENQDLDTSGIKVNTRINIVVTDYKFDNSKVSGGTLKSSTQEVICNNRVRPDDKLDCKASVTSEIQKVKGIRTNEAFIRPQGFAYTPPLVEVQHIGEGNIIYPRNKERTSFKEQKLSINLNNSPKATTTLDNTNLGESNYVQSSLSSLVKSGEVLKMTMRSTHMTDVLVPFTATAHFTAFLADKPISGDALMSLARNILVNVAPRFESNGEGTGEVLFNLSGEIKADVLVETNSYSTNDLSAEAPVSATPEIIVFTDEPEVTGFPVFTPPVFTNIPTASPTIATPITSFAEVPTNTYVEKAITSVPEASYSLGLVLPTGGIPCEPAYEPGCLEGVDYIMPIFLFPKTDMRDAKVCNAPFVQVTNSALGNGATLLVPGNLSNIDCAPVSLLEYTGSGYESPLYGSYTNKTGAQIVRMSFVANDLTLPLNNTEATCNSFAGMIVMQSNAPNLEEAMLEDEAMFTGGKFGLLELDSVGSGDGRILPIYENSTGLFIMFTDYNIDKPYRASMLIPIDDLCDQFFPCIGASFDNMNIDITSGPC